MLNVSGENEYDSQFYDHPTIATEANSGVTLEEINS